MRTWPAMLLVAGCLLHTPPEDADPRSGTSAPGAAARGWALRATVAEERGQPEEAERALRWVVRLDRSDPWAHVRLGEFLLRQQRPGDAATAFEDALDRDTGLGRAHLGLALSLLAREEEPGGHLELALQSDPCAVWAAAVVPAAMRERAARACGVGVVEEAE